MKFKVILSALFILSCTKKISGEEAMLNAELETNTLDFGAANDYHAALAQLHRWWQIYESPNPEVHFDIFAEDFVIDSATGQFKGLEAYKKRLQDFKGWKNAHHLKKATITKSTPEEIELSAQLSYQNIRPNGEKIAYDLQYDAVLVKRPGDLPVFKLIKLRPIGNSLDTTFVDAYAENRLKSFTHYWLYLMETSQGDAAPFKELLVEPYALDLGQANPVATWQGFETWAKSVPTWLAKSSHKIINESTAPAPSIESGLIKAYWEFDWQGLSIKNQPMIAETHHRWVLNANQGLRFASMKEMKVEVIVPFQVVK